MQIAIKKRKKKIQKKNIGSCDLIKKRKTDGDVFNKGAKKQCDQNVDVSDEA